MENFIFSLNVVLPVFIVIGLGCLIKSLGIVDEHFVDVAIKFNFKVGLSTLLFNNIYTAELKSVFNPKLLIFALLGISGTVLVLWVTVPIFIKDKKRASAMIQTMYRSNFILLGIPLATNMFGKSNIAPISMLIPIAVPAYNFFAVIVLAAFDENNDKNNGEKVRSTVISILKNPLIIGSMAAIIFKLFSIKLPGFLENSVSSVASLGTPMALITLGAQFDFKSSLENLKYSLIASFGRLVVVPSIVVSIAIILGFRSYELGGIFILFSAPAAISSYVMAKEMNSDYKLTGDIIMLTTLFSIFTIFTGIYLLKSFNLI